MKYIETRMKMEIVQGTAAVTVNVKCFDVSFRFVGAGSATIKGYPIDANNPLMISCESGEIYTDSFPCIITGAGVIYVLSRIPLG